MAFLRKVGTKVHQKVVLKVSSMYTPASDGASRFQETGKLSPEEFELAGDFLVENFPTWQWVSGPEDKRRKHLPPNKQYLLTKNVPCLPLQTSEVEERNVEGDGDDDGWVETGLTTEQQGSGDIADDVAELDIADGEIDDDIDDMDEDDVPDLDDFDYDKPGLIDEDPASLMAGDGTDDAVMKTRTYDIYICYDTYYSTPRVWLFGYKPDGTPLAAEAWKDDFSAEHIDKTVTFEEHPYLGVSCPAIHPCKHAEAMKRMVSLVVGATGGQLDVKYYMLIFLKFIQAIIPNIEYDYTGQFEINSSSAKDASAP